MKAIIRTVCAPKSKSAQYDAEDISVEVDLPFVPQPGTMLKVTAGGDFYPVDQVYWDISKPDWIEVWLVEPDDLTPWPVMRAEGWALS